MVNDMYNYIKGMVTEINSTNITLDNNGVGYKVFTPNPYSFQEGETYTVYIYQYVREDEMSLYGFKTESEKDLFLKLIDVKGLGPKMALPLLAMGSIAGISDAINRENVLYLKKFPKIGDKLAKQMILDLKGKMESKIGDVSSNVDHSNSELHDALIGLGYKDKEIKGILDKVDYNLTIGEQIKEALKLLLK